MQSQTTRKRKAVKEGQILASLRKQIVDGRLSPGSQLPTRTVLERQFGVSPITLQRALHRLSSDGFVRAKTGQGTFVVDEPPHLSRYGIVFPSYPQDQLTFNHFFAALTNEAMSIRRMSPNRLAIYHGIEHPAQVLERERLIDDVQSHRLAGLIFASPPFNFAGTPLIDEPQMARVAVMPVANIGNIPAVCLDQTMFVDKALDYLQSRQRKRIAVLLATGQQITLERPLLDGIAARGMECRPYWMHALHWSEPRWARNLVQLMWSVAQTERPDALLIADDNLAPHATAGLLAAGLRVPEEMDVVAHCNYPWPTTCVVPTKRLGYDARQVLSTCLQLIDMQRRGFAPPLMTNLPALLDDEVQTHSLVPTT